MTFRTVAGPVRFEGDKIKGSRFIAEVVPAASADAARKHLESVRQAFSDANHHCWAYRLGASGDDRRFHDDGEPTGSAGRPILRQIDGAGLTDVLVVVSRYFGGTRLGVGGLVRAYGGAAAEALRRAEVRVVVVTRELLLRYAYAESSAVERVMRAFGLTAQTVDYGEAVELRLSVAADATPAFREALADATAGRAIVEAGDALDP